MTAIANVATGYIMVIIYEKSTKSDINGKGK